MSRFPSVRAWFSARTSIDAALLEGPSFDDTIAARLHELGLSSDAAYATLLLQDEREAGRAQAMVAVPETWLFRIRPAFELLRERLVAQRTRGTRKVRMLSAGCANGAEPCSMAIAALAAGFEADAIHIDAVDLNPDVLNSWRTGRFGSMSLREGAPKWAEPWCRVMGDGAEVDAIALSTIATHHADLLRWNPTGTETLYDAVFCRNVLIYLDRAARKRLRDRLAAWVEPLGMLILGHADLGGEVTPGFRMVAQPSAFAQERCGLDAVSTRDAPGSVPPAERPAAPKTRKDPVPPQRAVSEPIVRKRQASGMVERGPAKPPTSGAEQAAEGSDLDAALALHAAGRSRESEAMLERHLRRRPNDARALFLLGMRRSERGEDRLAEEALHKVVYLDPGHEEALLALATLAERGGRTDTAGRLRQWALRAHLDAAERKEPR